MKEYYLVKIPDGDGYFTTICQKKLVIGDLIEMLSLNTDLGFAFFGNYVTGETFKDIITGKTIFCAENGYQLNGIRRNGCLTYSSSYGHGETYVEGIQNISPEKTLELLKNMSEDDLNKYKMTLNNLENEAIDAYNNFKHHKK